MITTVEVKAKAGDSPMKIPLFSRKNLSCDDFKAILLRFNDAEAKSDKSVSVIVKPTNNKAANFNQDMQNEQQLSDGNQDNATGILYEEYMPSMSIPMVLKVDGAATGLMDSNVDVNKEQVIKAEDKPVMADLGKDVKHNDNVVLRDVGTKNQIPARDRTDISQEKTNMQKPPDVVKSEVNNIKVASKSEPTVSVSKIEELIKQEVVASRSALHSQANVAGAQPKPVLEVDAQTSADQAKSNNVENNNARKLSAQGEVPFKVNPDATGADNVAKAATGLMDSNVDVNKEQVIKAEDKPVMADLGKDVKHNDNVVLRDVGTKNQIPARDKTDISQEKTNMQKPPDVVKSEVNNVKVAGKSEPTVLVSKAEELIKQEVVASRSALHSQADVADAQPKPVLTVDAQTTADQAKSNNVENNNSRKLSGQGEVPFKVNPDATGADNVVKSTAYVMGELVPVNTAQQSVISSKEPVIISELPQKVLRMMEQAKVKDHDKPIFLQLKLEPEQLGELVIKLTYKKGEMSAQFITSSLQAKEVLENSMKHLKDALAQQQVILHEPVVSVGFSGEQSMQHSRQNFNGKKYTQNSYKSNGSVDEGEGEVKDVSRHNDVLLSGKAVDYVI